MNKKVVLSVLSATVFASMAASAFAAPKSGLYIGGNVDKYYSMDTLFKMNSATSDQFSNELVQAGFSNLIYVDFDGKGASISDIMNATDFEGAKKDLKASQFEGVYANITADGTASGTYDPRPDSIGDDTGELKVDSVSAINGKQLEIKFGKPVLASTVLTGTTLNAGVKIVPLAGQTLTLGSAVGKLSDDGKTLTVMPQTTEFFNGKYSVVLDGTVTDEDANQLEEYNTIIDVQDTTRPSLVGVSYGFAAGSKTAVLEFSEPVKLPDAEVAFSFARADGVALNAATDFENTAIAHLAGSDNKKLVVVLDSVHANDKGKDIKVTITSLKDYKGNLISPNPIVTTIKDDTADVTAPIVQSVTVKDNYNLVVKFDEKLSTTFTGNEFTIGTGATASTSVTQDTTDPTKYTVNWALGLPKGLQTVVIPDVTDLNGNAVGATTNKIVNIALDEAAPALQSSKVEKINGTEYLVLTYSENVKPLDGVVINGTYVKDFVTTAMPTLTTDDGVATPSNAPISLYQPDATGKSKSVKIDLSALVDAATYTVALPASLVEDLNGVDSAAVATLTFTRTSDQASGKPVLDAAYDSNGLDQLAGNNIVEVHFTGKVNGASALNKANYSIEGATIKNVTLTQNNAGGAIVQLELDKNSATFSGARTVTISGVTSETGVAMTPVTTTEVITENVVPTVTKAELTSTNEITLTFSENVTSATAGDYEVWVNGALYTESAATAATGDHVEQAIATPAKTQTITLDASDAIDAAKLAQGVVVKKAATGSDVTDANGNALELTSVNVTLAP